jgi:hypothetical protein
MRKPPEKEKSLPDTGTSHDKLPGNRHVRGRRKTATILTKSRKKPIRYPVKSKIQAGQRKRVGSKVHLALLENKNRLLNLLDEMAVQAQEYEAGRNTWPIKEHQISSGKIVKVRVIEDPILDRMNDDLCREMNWLSYEVEKIDRLLNPPTSRPRETIYDQALLDLQSDLALTIPVLAEKYYPNYFPNRAGVAIEMMRQGIGRARRRNPKHLE